MSDNPIEVYRTTRPEAIEAYENYLRVRREWLTKVHDFCEEHSDTGKGWFNGFLRSEYFIGPVVPVDGKLAPGWRIDRKTGAMVPAMRTPEGKAIAAEMRELRNGPVFTVAGMPQEARGETTRDGGVRVYTFNEELGDGFLEVTWGTPVPQDLIDFEIWTRVPLSQWHAEREAAQS
jgi:hypothetical protein